MFMDVMTHETDSFSPFLSILIHLVHLFRRLESLFVTLIWSDKNESAIDDSHYGQIYLNEK